VSLSNSLTSSTFSQASGTPPTTTSASRSAINPSRSIAEMFLAVEAFLGA